MEKLTSFEELGELKKKLEKEREEKGKSEQPPKEEKKPENQPEQPQKEEQKETKRKRPFVDALSRVRNEMNRLGKEMVENFEKAKQYEESGNQELASKHREKAEYWKKEHYKAKDVKDKIKRELEREKMKKEASAVKKNKEKQEEKGGQEKQQIKSEGNKYRDEFFEHFSKGQQEVSAVRQVSEKEGEKIKEGMAILAKAEENKGERASRTPVFENLKREKTEQTMEKEKSPEEILDEKRQELAREYSKLKEKKLGIFGSELIENKEDSQRIALIENDYRESLKNYRQDLLEKNPEKAKEILLETVAEEANKFYGLKMDFRYEAKKGGKFERIKRMAGRAVERYRKIPAGYKYLLSAALFASGVGAGYAGGAAGWALATGMVSGRWFQRMFGGAAAAVGLEGLIKRSQEKKESKEVLKELGFETLNFLGEDGAKLDKKLFDLEGAKKRKKIGRFALAGTVGVLIMSGAVGKAIGNAWGMIPDSVKDMAWGIIPDSVKDAAGDSWKWLSGGVAEAPPAASETPPPHGAEEAVSAQEIQSVAIEKGGGVWNSAKELVKDPKEFSEAWKNSMVNVPGQEEAIHISDVWLVHPGSMVEYVSGEGGEAGHFEVKAPEGQELPDIKAQEAFMEQMQSKPEIETQIEAGDTIKESVGEIFRGDRGAGLQNLFGKEVFGGGGVEVSERGDGVMVIKDAFGKKGFDLLFTEDGKIGVDGPAKFNWGSKGGGFLGFGDRVPVEELNQNMIEGAKKFITENAKMLNELPNRED